MHKILGGKGKFSGQVYLYSLFFVPLGLISSLASLFQINSGCWIRHRLYSYGGSIYINNTFYGPNN